MFFILQAIINSTEDFINLSNSVTNEFFKSIEDRSVKTLRKLDEEYSQHIHILSDYPLVSEVISESSHKELKSEMLFLCEHIKMFISTNTTKCKQLLPVFFLLNSFINDVFHILEWFYIDPKSTSVDKLTNQIRQIEIEYFNRIKDFGIEIADIKNETFLVVNYISCFEKIVNK